MQVVRDVALIFSNSSFLVFEDYLYVLESMNNLISISSPCKLNYSFVFFYNKRVFARLNDSLI